MPQPPLPPTLTFFFLGNYLKKPNSLKSHNPRITINFTLIFIIIWHNSPWIIEKKMTSLCKSDKQLITSLPHKRVLKISAELIAILKSLLYPL